MQKFTWTNVPKELGMNERKAKLYTSAIISQNTAFFKAGETVAIKFLGVGEHAFYFRANRDGKFETVTNHQLDWFVF